MPVLFDHLVASNVGGISSPSALAGLEVDGKVELRRLLDGRVSRLAPAGDALP